MDLKNRAVHWTGGLGFLLLTLSVLLIGYLFQPLTARFSLQWGLLLAALYTVLALAGWLELRWLLLPAWAGSRPGGRRAWALAALLLGMGCFWLLTPSPAVVLERFPLLAPLETLSIRPALAAGERLTLTRLKIGQRQVPLEQIILEGDWRTDGLRLATADPQAQLMLTARVPAEVRAVFMRGPDAGAVEVSWGGQRRTLDLRADVEAEEVYSFSYDRSQMPPAALALRWLTLPGWLALAYVACSGLFTSWSSRSLSRGSPKPPAGRGSGSGDPGSL